MASPRTVKGDPDNTGRVKVVCMKNKMWVIAVGASLAVGAFAQQVPDTAFAPPIPNPMYQAAKGPVVLLDEAHFNFHTADGRYQPFAALLRRDGYDVRASKLAFSKASLKDAKIIVIANALAERNKTEWTLPTPPAFTDDEVRAVSDWVRAGGALLSRLSTIGAAQKWDTFASRMLSRIASARTWRRQTLVPARAASVQAVRHSSVSA